MGEREAVRTRGGGARCFRGPPLLQGASALLLCHLRGTQAKPPSLRALPHTSHGVLPLNILDAAQQVGMSSPLSLLILTQKMASGVVYRRMSNQK